MEDRAVESAGKSLLATSKKHFFTKVPKDALPGQSRLRVNFDSSTSPLQVLVPERARPGDYLVVVAGKEGTWKSCLVNNAGADGLSIMSGATEVSCEVVAPETETEEATQQDRNARDSSKLVVQVPEGFVGGDTLRLDVGGGQQLAMKVPKGAQPGQELVLEKDDAGDWKCSLMPLGSAQLEPPRIGSETMPKPPRQSLSQSQKTSTLPPETSPEPPSSDQCVEQVSGATPEFFFGLLNQLVTTFPKMLEQAQQQPQQPRRSQRDAGPPNADEALALAARLQKTDVGITRADLSAAAMHIEALVQEVRSLEEKLEQQRELGNALASEVADTGMQLRRAEQEKQSTAKEAEVMVEQESAETDHDSQDAVHSEKACGGYRSSANTPGPSMRAMLPVGSHHPPARHHGKTPPPGIASSPAPVRDAAGSPCPTTMMMPFGVARGTAGNPVRQCTSPLPPSWRATSPIPVAVQPMGSMRRAQSPVPHGSFVSASSPPPVDSMGTSWRNMPEMALPSGARRMHPNGSSPLLASPRAPQALVSGSNCFTASRR
mmetsp:Transcript_52213/g.122164  ORF Transcript_52213/g.122164 Transcript_52213/m.122164 type:complete len:546 (+) Transcript_52213:63-1700(+)